jgi:hypothetical protein
MANRDILHALSQYCEKYPQTRFHQALLNLGIVVQDCDQFYEESESTLLSVYDHWMRMNDLDAADHPVKDLISDRKT